MLACLLFEDEHLLVVNKPPGINTHSPGPYAGEGIYDWLRHREPRWATLSILHRLDKETSGILVFGKTRLANRSLTNQFTARAVSKKYLLLTDRPISNKEFTAKSCLTRTGEKYVSRPAHASAASAETRFRTLRGAHIPLIGGSSTAHSSACLLEAEPVTGRTHQIRVHAADKGIPILGDVLYGGTAAARIFLHAAELSLQHPASGQPVTFSAPAEFGKEASFQLRNALIDAESTNAFRLIHGASDGCPGFYLDRYGEFLLSQSEHALTEPREIAERMESLSLQGAYHKMLTRQLRQRAHPEASPVCVAGQTAPERFVVRENGLPFEISFVEGYSSGLFLDQRDNRRRLLTGHVAAGFPLFSNLAPSQTTVLNTFAYTCAFSVCAAKAGARTTSVDLSRKYLEWGSRNFVLNGLHPAEHDFIYGDVFDWLRRLDKKQRRFDVILLDPPTFSQSRQSGVFQAQKHYGKLVAAALPLLKRGGVLFASTNAADWPAEDFLGALDATIDKSPRKILQRHYVPQPPDFPVSRSEPAYLKTVWLKIG